MSRRSPHRGTPQLLMALLVTAACGGDAPPAQVAHGGHPIDVVDATGLHHTLAEPARRVISLVPSATLTLDALGARDALVARTDFDTASWTKALPSVGGGLHPSIETIVSLHPDLVIHFAGQQDAQTPQRLDELGITHLAIRPDRIADVRDEIELLGRVTGREARAHELIAKLDSALAAVRRAVAGRGHPRVAYVLGGTPPWVAGSGTYIDELIAIAGGENVFDDLGSLYAAVSPEELVARHIDVVLVLKATSFDRTLVPEARIEVVPGSLELPGPAVAEAARAVARLIHGDPSR